MVFVCDHYPNDGIHSSDGCAYSRSARNQGVELLSIHNKRFRAVVVRMTSEFNENGVHPVAAASEIWGSECRTEDRVGRIGGAFLGIALVAFIFGTTLELVMFCYVRRRRKLISRMLETDYNISIKSVSYRIRHNRFENLFDEQYNPMGT